MVDAKDARRKILESRTAVLGTLQVGEELDGWPYASVVPFALTPRGEPFVLIASIAQHTRNIKADSRVSFFLRSEGASGDEAQAEWRLCLMGRMAEVAGDDPEHEALSARYLERVPAAEEYRATHGFAFYRMSIEAARFIGGFGHMGWLAGDQLTRDPLGDGLAEAQQGVVEHMNADHVDALQDLFHGLRGREVEAPELLRVEADGCLIRPAAGEAPAFFSWDVEIGGDGARGAFIRLLKVARARIPGRNSEK